ncbi:DUF6879 family protein [Actinomadura harenae]|uniref:DUF6879 domain-containing protein n=1 Tax=Actinomadura harenae TaxID=2483351 RepID=A0A3M2M4Z0_9ACTN|nr:DUF6879 family protein [Actinomadura harenae]RMI44747.1 hypothetical protein EBO15_12440 [Actinomadura harenae]
MELISPKARADLINGIAREALHLEMRDNYGIDRELFANWRQGDRDEVPRTLKPWCDRVRAGVAEGKVYRRICVVSEPLSAYQRWCYEATNGLKVEAGEDLRWVPRNLTSRMVMPGNDFWLLDGEAVLFNVFDGSDLRAEIQYHADPYVVKSCGDIYSALWDIAIPHHEYRPV